jgi:mono/diheme cytochrome c family protein
MTTLNVSWFKLLRSLLLALSFGCLGLASFSASAEEDDRHGMVNDIEIPSDPATLAIGEERYKARCAYCHLASGRGGSSGVCLACQKYKWGSKASAIFATISAGRPGTKMGAFGNPETGLTAEQTFAVIAYIRTLQEKKIADDKLAPPQN